MDLDDTQINEVVVAEDNLLKQTLQSGKSAASSGVIASITYGDGKAIKSMYEFISAYKEITIEWFEQGIQIKEAIMEGGIARDMSYLVFDASKQLEYNFCPENIPKEFPSKENVCMRISVANIIGTIRDNKTATSVRFLYSAYYPQFLQVTTITGALSSNSVVPIIKLTEPSPYHISGDICSSKIQPIYKCIVESFCVNMAKLNKKIGNVSYDFVITLYTDGGICIQSLAPSSISYTHGELSGTNYKFRLEHKFAKRLAKLSKITPRTTLFFYALDNRILRLSQSISTIGMQAFFFQQTDRPQQIANQQMKPEFAQMQQMQQMYYQRQLQYMQQQYPQYAQQYAQQLQYLQQYPQYAQQLQQQSTQSIQSTQSQQYPQLTNGSQFGQVPIQSSNSAIPQVQVVNQPSPTISQPVQPIGTLAPITTNAPIQPIQSIQSNSADM